MFISKRAFAFINDIPYYKNLSRHYYECRLFKKSKKNHIIRIKGILYDDLKGKYIFNTTEKIINNYIDKDNITKCYFQKYISEIFILLLFSIIKIKIKIY